MSTRTRLYSSLLLAIGCAVATSSCSTGPKELRGWHWQRVPINQGSVVTAAETRSTPAASGLIVRDQAPTDALASNGSQEARAEPVEALRAEGATPVALGQAAPVEAPRAFGGRTVGFTFLFPTGGATLSIPDNVRADLIETAKAAGHITVIGRTDGRHYSASDEQVALRRALAGRAELVRAGVDPTKIAIEFASAADYAGENDTTAGRQANRRVEFLFLTPERYAALR